MTLPKPYYADSDVTLYHGDSREIVPLLPQVELVLTDPPFSEYTHDNAKSNRDKGHGNKAIDFKAIDFKAIREMLASLNCERWCIAFMDWRHISALAVDCPEPWEFVRFGVWVKTNPMPQISADRPANGWDGICYLHSKNARKAWNGGGNHGNWIGPVVTEGNHPTAKPLALIEQLVQRFTTDGETILDPFAGSGTTLLAAKRLGRKAIGIELDEEYCRVSAERLNSTLADQRIGQGVLITC